MGSILFIPYNKIYIAPSLFSLSLSLSSLSL